MKIYMSKFLLACSLLLLATGGWAAEVKIGYVDAARLLDEAPQAEAAADKLKSEFSSRESDLMAEKKELDKIQERLARDGDIMSESERKKLGIDVLSRQRELRRKQEEFRQDITIRRNDALGGLQDLIRTAIQNIGKQGNYDIIFYEGISYANPRLDLTDQVLAELRKKDRSEKTD